LELGGAIAHIAPPWLRACCRLTLVCIGSVQNENRKHVSATSRR